MVKLDDRLTAPETGTDARSRTQPSILDPVGRLVARPPKRRGRWLFWLAAGWLVVISSLAILADVLPLEPYAVPIGPPRQPPFWTWSEPLGTDQLGRSMTSRLIYGARVSLAVGVAAVTIGILVGGLVGLVAGYFRRATESIIGVLIDTMLAFPPLVLLLAITAVMTQSFRSLVIGLGVVSIPAFARLSRANTLPFGQREFVIAARSMGARHGRVLFREILPNVAFPVASYAFVVLAAVIVGEGSLSYLGLGIPPPQPSWGGMIASGRDLIATDPYLVFVPAAALLLTVFSFNVVGDRARRRFDVRESMLA
jgi:peptide/nickel transport system permease protein